MNKIHSINSIEEQNKSLKDSVHSVNSGVSKKS